MIVQKTLKPKSTQNIQHFKNYLIEKKSQFEAIAHYRKAIDLNPQQPFILYKRLGDLLQKQGQHPDAISAYQTALTLQPDNLALQNLVQKLTSSQHPSTATNG